MKIVAGNSNQNLARAIAESLRVEPVHSIIRRFADEEVFVDIRENVRGEDVFVIQSTCTPADGHLVELLVIIDALKRASARRVTAVMPYFGYARQDRKTSSRAPITAKLVANLITRAGADRILTLDLHSGQIQGFFDIPADNLFTAPVFTRDIRKTLAGKAITIVSPDTGGVVRARAIASRCGADLAIIDKRRPAPGQAQVMNVIGDVRSKTCLLVDDIVDSAGTLISAAAALKENGAAEVRGYATHPVLSGEAVEKIAASAITELVVTDSIPLRASAQAAKTLRVLSIAPLIAEAMRRTSLEESVSSLFED